MLCLKTFVAGAYLTPPYPYTYRPPSLGLKVFLNLSLMSKVNDSLETTQCPGFSSTQAREPLEAKVPSVLDPRESEALSGTLESLKMQLKSYKHMPRVQVCRLVLLIPVKSALTGRELGIWSGFCCRQ